MNKQELVTNANALVAEAKGILAADESSPTIKKRLDSIGVESTEERRRDYRQMLFTSKGFGEYVSGVILFDETIRQKGSDGRSMVDYLAAEGVIPGIKVDQGAKDLVGFAGEKVTEGLDGLLARCQEYYQLGARFTKWRAVITIGDAIPTPFAIEANAHALARYAAVSQAANLVPIVEPEVLMDGDHSIERCFEVTEAALRELYSQLGKHRVLLEGTLLKPNMVLSGKGAADRADARRVGEMTVTCFQRTVPAAVPGIVFLSGGQSDEEATANLDAINRHAAGVGAPWQLSFSYGRGLQAAPLKAWGGEASNVEAAQQAFLHRAKLTSLARQGQYSPEMETAGV